MNTNMAQRYEQAWHKVYYESPRWIQAAVIDDPTGRLASTLAQEAVLVAEIDNKPITTGILSND
jgi:hypothetical protein